MSVPVQDPINQVVIVGGETLIPWTWNLQQQSEITVLVQRASTGLIDTLTLDADYTVDVGGLDNDNGGNITPIGSESPVTAGDIWTMFRVTAIDRSPDFATSGGFFALTINEQLDELTRIAQDVNRDVAEAVRKDPGVGDTLNPLIPQPVDERALKFRDTGGGNFEMVMSDNDPDQQANEATASAAAALASEQAAALSETAAGISETNAATSENNAATSETNAAISAASGHLKNVVSVSTNTTLTVSNQGNEIRVDTTSGNINITLPDSTTLTEDFRVSVVKVSADANVVNVNRSGADTINLGTTINQGEQFVRRTYALDQSAGTWVIDASAPDDLSSPPAIGDVTPNSIKGTTVEATTSIKGTTVEATTSIKGATVEATTSIKGNAGQAITQFDNDGNLAANSSTRVPTQQAVKTFVESTNVASQAEMEAASNITKKVTPGRQKFHPGMAKAWITFNGTGTIAIVGSYNITSIMDNGTGLYTITLDTDFSNTAYTFTGFARDSDPSGDAFLTARSDQQKFVGSVEVTTSNTGGTVIDSPEVNVTFFGDQ